MLIEIIAGPFQMSLSLVLFGLFEQITAECPCSVACCEIVPHEEDSYLWRAVTLNLSNFVSAYFPDCCSACLLF